MLRLTVLVDNRSAVPGVESDWALSILVETGEARVLFDTGANPSILARNAERLGVDLRGIDAVVLSHRHMDHAGGIPALHGLRVPVYYPAGSGERLRRYIEGHGLVPVENRDVTRVAGDVYAGKPFPSSIGVWEQAGAVLYRGRLYVLVGCSHPGVDVLAEHMVESLGGEPWLVIGGMHRPPRERLDRLVELGFHKIAPIHCSGDEAREYLASRHRDRFLDAGAGSVFYEE